MISLFLLLGLAKAAMIGTLHWPHSTCPWLQGNTGRNNVLHCFNGTDCFPNTDPLGWGCCNCKGGRAKCPSNLPLMCASTHCGGGTAYCCGMNAQSCSYTYRPCPAPLAPTVNGDHCDIPILEFTPKENSCVCASVTDPHWKTCGGKSFDNHMRGDVLAYKGPDITVNLRQRPCEVNPRYSCNQAFAAGGSVTCGITISGTIGNIVGKPHREPVLYVTKGGDTRKYVGTAAMLDALGEGGNQDPRIAACPTMKKNCISHPAFVGNTSVVCIFPKIGIQIRFTDLSGPALRWGLNFNMIIPPGKEGSGTCGSGSVGPLPCNTADNLFVTETYAGSGQNPCENSTSPPSATPTCDPALKADAEEYCKVCKSVNPNGQQHFEDCVFDVCAGGSLVFGAEIVKQCKEWPYVPGQNTPAPTTEQCDVDTERNCIRTGEAVTNNPKDCQLFCMEDDTCIWWSLSGMDCKFCEEQGQLVNSPGKVSGNLTCNTDGITPVPTTMPTDPPTMSPTDPTPLPTSSHDPDCGWVTSDGDVVHTGVNKDDGDAFQCQDRGFCDGGACCDCRGGRYRCPKDFPEMCEGTMFMFAKKTYYICAARCVGPFGTIRECDNEIGFVPHDGEYPADHPNCQTEAPTNAPTTPHPTMAPTDPPTTPFPTIAPTDLPTTSHPTFAPTDLPTTSHPTMSPTQTPTTSQPTTSPTQSPTTPRPTSSPTASPVPETVSPTASPVEACNIGATLDLINPTTVTSTTIPADCEKLCMEDGECIWWSMTGQDCSMAGEKEDTDPTPTPNSESGKQGCGGTTDPLGTPAPETTTPTAMPVADPDTELPTATPETLEPTTMPVAEPETTSPTVSPVEGCNVGSTLDLINPTTVTVETTIPSDCEELCMEDNVCIWWSMTGQDCSMAGEKEDTDPVPTPNSESGEQGCGGSKDPLGTPAPVADPTEMPTAAPPTDEPTATPVEDPTMMPSSSPTCMSCREFDGKAKACQTSNAKYAMCDDCTWDKKKKTCTVMNCNSFTALGPYKCHVQAKKHKINGGVCHYNFETKTCSEELNTNPCSFFASPKKMCKKLGKAYHGCVYEKNAKKCLEKDEPITCDIMIPKPAFCKRTMRKPRGGCMVEGTGADKKCVPYAAAPKTDKPTAPPTEKTCAMNTVMGQCRSAEKGCYWTEDTCKDLPTTAREECQKFDGKPAGCRRNMGNDGTNCIYAQLTKFCV